MTVESRMDGISWFLSIHNFLIHARNIFFRTIHCSKEGLLIEPFEFEVRQKTQRRIGSKIRPSQVWWQTGNIPGSTSVMGINKNEIFKGCIFLNWSFLASFLSWSLNCPRTRSNRWQEKREIIPFKLTYTRVRSTWSLQNNTRNRKMTELKESRKTSNRFICWIFRYFVSDSGTCTVLPTRE